MTDRTVYAALAFAGALPFLACALLPLAGVASVPPFGSLDEVANSYGLAIVSFLAGIHWGIYLVHPERPALNLFIGSNVVFLIAWFAYLLASLPISLVTQILALGVLLLVDRSLTNLGILTSHYFRIRVIVTSIVVACLALTALV